MKKNLCVGILREIKRNEKRAPLTPKDVNWLVRHGISVEVESSRMRIFKDRLYRKAGARVLKKFQKATLLVGIKEPRPEKLHPHTIYMLFSHTTKGQLQNIPLLRSCLERNITLVDYEKIVDSHNKRLVYFGRFAGICGTIDSLAYAGKKLASRRIKSPLLSLKPSFKYKTFENAKKAIAKIKNRIQRKGFNGKIKSFIVGVTGHGHVSGGVQEILGLLDAEEIHPKDLRQFVKENKGAPNKIYKVLFRKKEKVRLKHDKTGSLEDYTRSPEKFESNIDKYLPYLNLLINASYWDSRYPRTITREMIEKLRKKKTFNLGFIGDISCDIDGGIELTHKATTLTSPTFTYDPGRKKFNDGYKPRGITVMAVDNLPVELPKDSSQEFSALIRDYVYKIALHGTHFLTHDDAMLPGILKAVVTEDGALTKRFAYLRRYLQHPLPARLKLLTR